MRSFLVLLFLLLGYAPNVGRVHAQETELSDDARARALFDAGQRAYDAGEYQLALELFERSRTLSGRAALLYNMGMCADRLRADDDAIRYFERYLAAAPDAANREDVEQRLEALRSANGGSALLATAIAPVEEAVEEDDEDDAPTDTARSDNTPGIALVVVGGGVILVGVGLLIASGVDTATVENASGVPFASVRSAYERAPILSGAGWAALALGAGAAAIGAVILLIAPNEEELALHIGPGSLRLEGSF